MNPSEFLMTGTVTLAVKVRLCLNVWGYSDGFLLHFLAKVEKVHHIRMLVIGSGRKGRQSINFGWGGKKFGSSTNVWGGDSRQNFRKGGGGVAYSGVANIQAWLTFRCNIHAWLPVTIFLHLLIFDFAILPYWVLCTFSCKKWTWHKLTMVSRNDLSTQC